MRIYSNADLNVLFIEGVGDGPVTDFSIETSGIYISIMRISRGIYELKSVPFTSIQDVNGNSFANMDLLVSYLNTITQVYFPFRFSVEYPLVLDDDARQIKIDENYFTDGGNF